MVLEAGQLGWRRWHSLRQQVLAALLERARALPSTAEPDATAATIPHSLPAADHGRLDSLQRQAVAAVLLHRLVLLQGGPGTGKTSTVAAMLAAVLERQPGTRLQLAAPTGKAAARLKAATGGRHPCGTLHRLLESRGDRFARNRRHPLALDLLVVDEVSMVDLELMAALLEALPTSATLVLVGDPAQLPPIAPGAVLLDLQHPALRQALGAAAITLTTAYRNAGAIAAVAAALRAGLEDDQGDQDPLTVLQPRLETLTPADNLSWHRAPLGPVPAEVRRRLEGQLVALAMAAAGCHPGRDLGWRELLALRERLLVLSPRRGGPWGVDTLHRLLLGEATALPALWPEGLPVLCSRNLPELGLANGDVGVLVGQPGSVDRQVLFDGEEPLWIHPAQLGSAAEPALALTVHKAQGSEAAELIVLMPEARPDPRLLYTALTRARERALLVVPTSVRESCEPPPTRPD
jgi:exodeoxyribonuclease V alpha subunit